MQELPQAFPFEQYLQHDLLNSRVGGGDSVGAM